MSDLYSSMRDDYDEYVLHCTLLGEKPLGFYDSHSFYEHHEELKKKPLNEGNKRRIR